MSGEQISVLLCCTDDHVARRVARSLMTLGEDLYGDAGTLSPPSAPVPVHVRVLAPGEGAPPAHPASWLVVRLWQPHDTPSGHGVPAGGRPWGAVVPMIAHSPAEAAEVVHRLVRMRCQRVTGAVADRGEAVATEADRSRH